MQQKYFVLINNNENGHIISKKGLKMIVYNMSDSVWLVSLGEEIKLLMAPGNYSSISTKASISENIKTMYIYFAVTSQSNTAFFFKTNSNNTTEVGHICIPYISPLSNQEKSIHIVIVQIMQGWLQQAIEKPLPRTLMKKPIVCFGIFIHFYQQYAFSQSTEQIFPTYKFVTVTIIKKWLFH